MPLCNLTIQQLVGLSVSHLGHCPVEGCGVPVAFHRNETVIAPPGIVVFPALYAFISSQFFPFLLLFDMQLHLVNKQSFFPFQLRILLLFSLLHLSYLLVSSTQKKSSCIRLVSKEMFHRI
jgi:hypothetical protein